MSSSFDPNTVVSRFTLGGRNFYLLSKWGPDEFNLHITDGKYAWFGKGTNRMTASFVKLNRSSKRITANSNFKIYQ
jgi:hypothetical protein